jgi:hypothetical protein
MAANCRESARAVQVCILFPKTPQTAKKAYLKGFWYSFRNVILIFFNTFNATVRPVSQYAPFQRKVRGATEVILVAPESVPTGWRFAVERWKFG